jgi:hypothetical protein
MPSEHIIRPKTFISTVYRSAHSGAAFMRTAFRRQIFIWQFDYIHIDRCRFVFNTDAGIYTNIRNSDWRVQNSLFINPPKSPTQRADSMYVEHVAGYS